jgi:cytochrome bd ubiquinol oxidase subunit I
MRLIAFLTNAVYMAAASALPGLQRGKARVLPHWGLGPVGVSISIRLFALTDLCVPEHQLAKLTAIAKLKTQPPASEVLIAVPSETNERNFLSIVIADAGQPHRLWQLDPV